MKARWAREFGSLRRAPSAGQRVEGQNDIAFKKGRTERKAGNVGGAWLVLERVRTCTAGGRIVDSIEINVFHI